MWKWKGFLRVDICCQKEISNKGNPPIRTSTEEIVKWKIIIVVFLNFSTSICIISLPRKKIINRDSAEYIFDVLLWVFEHETYFEYLLLFKCIGCWLLVLKFVKYDLCIYEMNTKELENKLIKIFPISAKLLNGLVF